MARLPEISPHNGVAKYIFLRHWKVRSIGNLQQNQRVAKISKGNKFFVHYGGSGRSDAWSNGLSEARKVNGQLGPKIPPNTRRLSLACHITHHSGLQ
jgi:hypothetical protein